MKPKALMCLLLCIATATIGGTAYALDEAVLTPTPERSVAGMLRIALKRYSPSISCVLSAENLEYYTSSKNWAVLPVTQMSVKPGEPPTPNPTDARQPLQVRGSNGPVTITQADQVRSYRGTIEISSIPQVAFVNLVRLEDYLKSVVTAEMPASFPLEALKAQAVAARTYTLANIGRHQELHADLCDTTDCQAYHGIGSEKEAGRRAVFETDGQTLQVNGKILYSEYGADCGGFIAQINALGPASCHCDGPNDSPTIDPYCSVNPKRLWQIRITQKELLSIAGETRTTQLKRLKILSRDASGRIEKLLLVHDYGESELSASDLRKGIGPGRLKSLLCRFSADAATGDIVVDGSGSGHGRGLCQWGAKGMASFPNNKGYKEILAHYYPGAVLLTAPEASAVPPTPLPPSP